MKKIIFVIILLLNFVCMTKAQVLSAPSVSDREIPAQKANETDSVSPQPDSVEVSLLTCTPGSDAYAMYGHSAIRVHNLTSGADLIFNYGMFNYDEDNFIFKFVKGETDYVLGAESGEFFFGRYARKGDGISEQVLNMTQAECRQILTLLMINLQPENRTYRYNWLYDNCTTRARDMIERSIDGKIVYNNQDRKLTARQILHQFNKVNRWLEFGENFILGYELDTVLTKRQQMFIPSFYEADVDSAVIERPDGSIIPLVKERRLPLMETKTREDDTTNMPQLCWQFLACLVAAITVLEFRRKKTYKWVDAVLQFAEGLAGLLVAFLFFFSEHAGVSSNMLIFIFNPLSLIFIPFFLKRKINIVNYVILAEFICFFVTLIATPQHYDPALWLLVLILLMRLVANMFIKLKVES